MTRPSGFRPVVRRLSDGRLFAVDEVGTIPAQDVPGRIVCTRCNASRPRPPSSPAWFTFRFGCPDCAGRRDLPDRPPAGGEPRVMS